MAKSTTPATAGDQTEPAVPAPVPPPETGFWRYRGGVPRTYMAVPVTVEDGDVIAHDGVPAQDGHWAIDPGPATRQPDNAPPPEPPATPAGDAPTTGTGEE